MKIECVKIINPITDKEDRFSSSLTIGRSYIVLAISIRSNHSVAFRCIRNDGRTPVLFNADQFKIVSKKIPSNWVVITEDYGGLTFSPEKWLRSGFWEDFFDGDPIAIEEFEQEKNIVYQEED